MFGGMEQWWKRSWAQLVLLALLGVALIDIAELAMPHGWIVRREVIKHIGTAFLVATIVAAVFHIREVKEHITQFTRGILLENAFLETLAPETLRHLRRQIAKALLRTTVTNEKFEYGKLDEQLEEMLFGKLQAEDKGERASYRSAYAEHLELTFMTGVQLAQAKGISASPEPDRIFVEFSTITRYRLICPKSGPLPKGHPPRSARIACDGRLSRISWLSEKQQLECSLSIGGNPVALSPTINVDGGALNYECPHDADFTEEGVLQVETTIVEIERADDAPFMLKQMTSLTEAPRISVNGNVSEKLINMHVLGLGGHERKRDGAHSFTLQCTGWMAEFHGYVVWWTPSDVSAGFASGPNPVGGCGAQ